MKIGILSMQRVVNYGSFLQAYALRQLIKNICQNEASVSFIDIIPGENLFKLSGTYKFRSILNSLTTGTFISKISDRLYMMKLSKQFRKYFYPLLGLDISMKDDNFDCVVIGSDEVFHCCQNTSWGFTTQLYGDIDNSKKIITYAASFGATTYDKLIELKVDGPIKKALRNLSAISVRDKNSENIINHLSTIKPVLNLDPVLIYDFSDEINFAKKKEYKEKYLLVYSYTGRINDPEEIASIVSFAKKHCLKIYTAFCRYNWADKSLIPDSPFELLSIFQKADYVISDTFHGTIFSIITKKQFCTLVRENNYEKITSMLNVLKLRERAIRHNQIEEVSTKLINYEITDKILEVEKKRSKQYLIENIGKI